MGEKITCLSGTNINETRLFISAGVYTGSIEQTQYPYQSTQHISPIEHIVCSCHPVADCWQAPLKLAAGQSHPLLHTHWQTLYWWKCDPHILTTPPLHLLPNLPSLLKSPVRPSEQRIFSLPSTIAISSHTGKAISMLCPAPNLQLGHRMRKWFTQDRE